MHALTKLFVRESDLSTPLSVGAEKTLKVSCKPQTLSAASLPQEVLEKVVTSTLDLPDKERCASTGVLLQLDRRWHVVARKQILREAQGASFASGVVSGAFSEVIHSRFSPQSVADWHDTLERWLPSSLALRPTNCEREKSLSDVPRWPAEQSERVENDLTEEGLFYRQFVACSKLLLIDDPRTHTRFSRCTSFHMDLSRLAHSHTDYLPAAAAFLNAFPSLTNLYTTAPRQIRSLKDFHAKEAIDIDRLLFSYVRKDHIQTLKVSTPSTLIFDRLDPDFWPALRTLQLPLTSSFTMTLSPHLFSRNSEWLINPDIRSITSFSHRSFGFNKCTPLLERVDFLLQHDAENVTYDEPPLLLFGCSEPLVSNPWVASLQNQAPPSSTEMTSRCETLLHRALDQFDDDSLFWFRAIDKKVSLKVPRTDAETQTTTHFDIYWAEIHHLMPQDF